MLTLSQLKAIVILQRVVASLSLIGSSLIIYTILSDHRRKLASTYCRLVLGISVFDIISSIAFACSSLMLPKGPIWNSRGNDTTCTIQGSMFQIGLGVLYYNSSLMLYYLLRIKYNHSETWIKAKVEKWMHIFSLFMVIVPTLIGLYLRVYNSVGMICFAGEHPRGCTKNPNVKCDRGEKAYEFSWAASLGPLIITMVWMCVCLIMILSTIKSTVNNMKRYEFESVRKMSRTSFTSKLHSMRTSSQGTKTRNISVTEEKKKSRSRKAKVSLVKEARLQAIRYIFIYVGCYIWPLIIRAMNEKDLIFELVVLSNFFYPLQGLLNYINFVWPRVKRHRSDNAARNWLHAFYLATFVKETDMRRKSLQAKVKETYKIQHSKRLSAGDVTISDNMNGTPNNLNSHNLDETE